MDFFSERHNARPPRRPDDAVYVENPRGADKAAPWVSVFAEYGKAEAHMMMMLADARTNGLIATFPKKFTE